MSDEKKVKKVSNTLLLPCSCANAYQDQRYGQGRRVHNRSGKKDSARSTCTVCGAKK